MRVTSRCNQHCPGERNLDERCAPTKGRLLCDETVRGSEQRARTSFAISSESTWCMAIETVALRLLKMVGFGKLGLKPSAIPTRRAAAATAMLRISMLGCFR